MADKQTPNIDPRAERSRRARALLEDPVLQEALSNLADRAVNGWIASEPEEHEKREYLWLRLRVVQELRQELESIATDAAVRAFNSKGVSI